MDAALSEALVQLALWALPWLTALIALAVCCMGLMLICTSGGFGRRS